MRLPWKSRAVVEGAVEVERRANQGQMGEGLGKVTQRFALTAGLLCIEPKMIGVAQHLLEDKTCIFQARRLYPAGPRRAL